MSGSAIEWSPPSTIGTAPAASTVADRVLDRPVRAHGVGGEDRRVAEVDHPQRLAQGVDAGLEVGAGARSSRARIARGPKRVPGASEVSSSIGAPTIATSAPASSAGSSV